MTTSICVFFGTMFLWFKWTFFQTLEQILALFLITMNLFFALPTTSNASLKCR